MGAAVALVFNHAAESKDQAEDATSGCEANAEDVLTGYIVAVASRACRAHAYTQDVGQRVLHAHLES